MSSIRFEKMNISTTRHHQRIFSIIKSFRLVTRYISRLLSCCFSVYTLVYTTCAPKTNTKFCSKTGQTKALIQKKRKSQVVITNYLRFPYGARSGTRTRTGVTAQGILSPSHPAIRAPFQKLFIFLLINLL